MQDGTVFTYSIFENDREVKYTFKKMCNEFVITVQHLQHNHIVGQTNELVISKTEWEVLKKFIEGNFD